ncbi:hypothetical protein B0T20DRAFT_390694 [Sordaria brevicollis]|uniref:Uncharacterized protein n=1 Tax=Sordaria brevicollis TaxID=83679 RepID=A0AAE0PJ42_SORBR|nr:hypothetical protein B0T20DRAFT_390694 [Sordaria brevicollis]
MMQEITSLVYNEVKVRTRDERNLNSKRRLVSSPGTTRLVGTGSAATTWRRHRQHRDCSMPMAEMSPPPTRTSAPRVPWDLLLHPPPLAPMVLPNFVSREMRRPRASAARFGRSSGLRIGPSGSSEVSMSRVQGTEKVVREECACLGFYFAIIRAGVHSETNQYAANGTILTYYHEKTGWTENPMAEDDI